MPDLSDAAVPPTGPVVDEVEAARPSCFCRCWGARCRICKTWLSKHDFTPEDAVASAAGSNHRCTATPVPPRRAAGGEGGEPRG